MRALAIVVSLLLAAPPTMARAADPAPVAEMKLAAPEKYGPLVWKFNEQLTPGYWFTEAQVVRVNTRITFLETKAAKECVDAQIEASKALGQWWKIGAGILAGAAIGFCAAHSGHCGIAK